MPKLNQLGVTHLLIPLLLLAGIIGVVYLVTAGPLNLFPKASISGPTGPSTSFVLSPNANTVKVGDQVAVKIVIRSDVAATNLFAAKMQFPKDLLAVDRIDYTNSIIVNPNGLWIEQYFDNSTGEISLVAGYSDPGFQTNPSSAGAPMAVIYFKALKTGSATIAFTDDSAIYDNANNLNILSNKVNTTVSITTGGISVPVPPTTPKPTSTPSPTPKPSATPIPGTGDGNNNGKIDLGDVSVLLTDFNKTTGFRKAVDMNGDGKINTFDFALMRNLLIQKGVIKG